VKHVCFSGGFDLAVFVRSGDGMEESRSSMPVSIVVASTTGRGRFASRDLGIGACLIFPYTEIEDRDRGVCRRVDPQNNANRAIRGDRKAVPDMVIMTDVALDTYNITVTMALFRRTYHRECRTVEALVKMSLAQGGCGPRDIIGPSI